MRIRFFIFFLLFNHIYSMFNLVNKNNIELVFQLNIIKEGFKEEIYSDLVLRNSYSFFYLPLEESENLYLLEVWKQSDYRKNCKSEPNWNKYIIMEVKPLETIKVILKIIKDSNNSDFLFARYFKYY